MNAGGVLRFGRYAFPPNRLGYCGPDDNDALLGYIVGGRPDQGMVELERRFEGAYPYLVLIAHANRIADPFDPRVVEAYWIGNDLLRRVGEGAFRESLGERFAGRLGPRPMSWLLAKPGEGAAPHHNFHVFEVFPRAGLMNGDTAGPVVEVMDSCRISWGQVTAIAPGGLTVRRRPLELIAGRLALGPAREMVAANAGYVASAKPGDVVSMHWSWACEVLTPADVRRLRAVTDSALALCNRTI